MRKTTTPPLPLPPWKGYFALVFTQFSVPRLQSGGGEGEIVGIALIGLALILILVGGLFLFFSEQNRDLQDKIEEADRALKKLNGNGDH